MSKKKQSKVLSHTESVRKSIETLATTLGIEPNEIGRNDLLDAGVSDYSIRRAGGLSAILRAHYPVSDKDLGGIRATKTRGSYLTKLETLVGSRELLHERLAASISSMPKISIKPFKTSKKGKIERELTIVLSDLHIGSDIKAEQTGSLDFGAVEESRRLARIVKEVCGYKPQYRKHTKLNVLLLGDIIQNQLHDQRDGAPLAEQAGRAMHLLNQALAQFSANFPRVDVYCNTGNHGRLTSRHHSRAVNQKWDSIETIIYYSLQQSCSNLSNVKLHIPKTPFIVYEVFGKKIFATHGDTVFNVGYPGKVISTGKLETQVNRFNAALSDKDEYSVLIVGHVHTASITHLSNGAITITNGAMVPVDEYAVSIGLMETVCGQYLFESVKGYPVGDARLIQVTEVDDKDKSLDTIIKPWTN